MNNSSVANGTSRNGSFSNMIFPHFSEMEWIFGIILTHSVFGLFIILSNIVVLHAFYKNTRLRTTTNLVIMSMALADLAVGLVVIPIWLYIINIGYIDGPPFTRIEINMFEAYQYMDQSLSLTSIYHLVYLHSLRSYSIVYPLRHRQMAKRSVIVGVLSVWAVCIMFPPVIRKLIVPKSCANCFVYITLISNIGVPLVIISIANFILWRSVAKSSRQHQKKDRKLLVTVAILIGLLCVCFFPFLIVNIIERVHGQLVAVEVIFILKFLHFSNSGLNPVVYAMRNPDLGRTVRSLFCGKTLRDVSAPIRTPTTRTTPTTPSNQ